MLNYKWRCAELLSTRLLEALTASQLVRRIMGKLFESGHLDDTLDNIVGKRQKYSVFSLLSSMMLRLIILVGAAAFGTGKKLIKENLSNPLFRRAFASVIRGLIEFGITKPFVPGAPFQVVWNVTRSCNLRCKHCYESAGQKDPFELSTDEALKCIDKLADEGVVFLAFSGGEPTLRPDILALIRKASSRNMYVAIATNATTLANVDRVKQLKAAGLSFVQISLDGATAETHDDFRGVLGSFDRTIRGIKNCVKEDLFVEIAMTATHHNLHEVPDTIKLAKQLGARWFMVYNFVPVGNGKEIVDTDLTPDERETLLLRLWDQINTKTGPNEMEVLSTSPQLGRLAREVRVPNCTPCSDAVFPTHFSNTRLPEKMKDLASFIGGCGAGRFYLSIEPNGDIYPCVFFPHTSKVRIGNILDCDFHKIWTRSKVLRRLRNRNLLSGHCGSCNNRYVCGGCRARAMGYFDDYLAPDPGCINNRQAWHSLCQTTQDLGVHHIWSTIALELVSYDANFVMG